MSARDAYRAFLEAKRVEAPSLGFAVEEAEVNPALKPHCRAIVPWACRGGRRAIFASFGLHKTSMQLEILRLCVQRFGGRALVVVPLGVRHEFFLEAAARHPGVALRFLRRDAEVAEAQAPGAETVTIHLTNYESVRDGKLDPRLFTAASLDEAACLRGFGGSKTFREFMRLFEGVRFRFCCTAVPDPNEYIELLAYAAFLGVMEVGEAKTRFFKRDSTKADKLTLHPHKTEEFWLWVASWALFIQRPSDLCGCSCHKGEISQDSGSGGYSSSSGNPEPSALEPGSAGATAAGRISQPQHICSQDGSPAAAACAPSTEEKAPGCMPSGAPCERGATPHETRIGRTTAGEVSASAGAGRTFATSESTWESRPQAPASIGSTTTGTMSPETAAGHRGKSKLETAAWALDGGASTSCPLCRCDEGYELPPLDVRWHEIPSDHAEAGAERDGQGRMFRDSAAGVVEAAAEKRQSLPARIAALLRLRAEDPGAHRLIWHDLESERAAIEAACPTAVSVWGSQDLEERERRVVAFARGEIAELATKPVISGSGCNFQAHCAWSIYFGIGFKFHDFIQSIFRTQRFGQTHRVRVDLIYTEAEREIRRELEAKWARFTAQAETMAALIRRWGLAEAALQAGLARAIGVERRVARGERFELVNNDCVEELQQRPAASVDLVVTSIPFATQYEYTPSFNDFGHTDDNDHFWRQMDFLTPELLRVLQPGRVAAIHVKDRIVPGGVNGLGFQTVQPFSDECVAHFQRHGFAFLARKTVVTDVVRENNQTYRLGWSEQCKDGSRMGCGLPEYVLLFRKPPSDLSDGYADRPVTKPKPLCLDAAGEVRPFDKKANWRRPAPGTGYSRARWQLDAHGFMRVSGDRLLTAEELAGLPHEALYKLWRERSTTAVTDFAGHLGVTEELDRQERLPSTFMLLPPHSWHPDVWSDITRMRTLNGSQQAKGREMHLCPLQFDIVDRLIAQFSMPDELVLDPFSGLGTVALRALQLGRRGLGIELNGGYHDDAVTYLQAEERRRSTPTLFDLLALEDQPPGQEPREDAA